MIRTSRPLRFLVAVVGGWVGVRAALLWPVAEAIPTLGHAVAPAVGAESVTVPAQARLAAGGRTRSASSGSRARLAGVVAAPARLVQPEVEPLAASPFLLGATRIAFLVALPSDPIPLGVDPPPALRASRWSGSAWAILRPDGRATPFASQLGGSQAGARVAYAFDGARRLAVYARASTAIDAREREAAVGVDWRPAGLAVHLIAERRIGIEGVRSGTAVGAVGGVGPTRVVGPVRVEGYAQAGVIFREGSEGFADGSLRFTLPATGRVDLGLGAWGGAQQGAARVDVGPTLGLTLPVDRHALRLAVDWRRRVAGDARPGSGPAVSLGVDF